MKRQKKVLAIHDISCTGRCSLTVALPILSCAQVDCAVLPTAVLSTHTGGFEGFTYRDLTEDIIPISDHWKKLDLKFDALYSGFLGSFEQIDLVSKVFKDHKKENGIILVDPVMADNGKLYSIYNQEMVKGMAKLCGSADIICPNLTEAAFMLNLDYVGDDYDEKYIKDLVIKLSELGARKVVLTGISFSDNKLGACCYDSDTNEFNYVDNNRVEGAFHGTGDVFGSTLLSGLVNDFNLVESTKIAVDYTLDCIEATLELDSERKYGVAFEMAIPKLIKYLGF